MQAIEIKKLLFLLISPIIFLVLYWLFEKRRGSLQKILKKASPEAFNELRAIDEIQEGGSGSDIVLPKEIKPTKPALYFFGFIFSLLLAPLFLTDRSNYQSETDYLVFMGLLPVIAVLFFYFLLVKGAPLLMIKKDRLSYGSYLESFFRKPQNILFVDIEKIQLKLIRAVIDSQSHILKVKIILNNGNKKRFSTHCLSPQDTRDFMGILKNNLGDKIELN